MWRSPPPAPLKTPPTRWQRSWHWHPARMHVQSATHSLMRSTHTSVFGGTIASLIHIASEEDSCGSYAEAVTDALSTHLSNGGSPVDFDGLRRDWYNSEALGNHLEAERLEDEAQEAPLLIVQGDADRQIPLAATDSFVNSQLALGTNVTYEVIVGGRHGDPGRQDFGLTLTWLEAQFPPR